MGTGEMDMGEGQSGIERFLAGAFQILGIALFAILAYYGVGMTAENRAIGDESLYESPDSVLGSIFWLVAFAMAMDAALHAASRLGKYAPRAWHMQAAAAAAGVAVAAFGAVWVWQGNTAPQADQLEICHYADAFNAGDYSGLDRGGYVGIYQQQLGIITLLRILFSVFGAGNYKSFQYLSAIMAGLLVFFGFQVVRLLSNGSGRAEAAYLLLSVLCVPLYGYVPFVYGEVCSSSILMLSFWMLLSALRTPLRGAAFFAKAAAFGISAGLAVQLRKNSLIVLIAFAIVLLVKTAASACAAASAHAAATSAHAAASVRPAALLVFLAAGHLLLSAVTGGIYGGKIPEDSEPMPAILYVAMGLNWDGANPGWYNGYSWNAYAAAGYDADAAREAARGAIGEFALACLQDDGYAVDFYVHKMTAQWEAPMYQCLAMNNRFAGERGPLAESVYFGVLRAPVQKFMNAYQLFVYFSVLLLLLGRARRGERPGIEGYAMLIGVFGGFLFTLIWEAKARYVLPYFLFMLPYAAIGFTGVLARGQGRAK